MKRFYVLEQGCYIRKNGYVLQIWQGDKVIDEVSLERLEQLTIVGRSSLSGAVLDELVRRRIETVLLTPEGRFRARIVVDEHKHVERRMKQYLMLSDPLVSGELASAIVESKLKSYGHILIRRSWKINLPSLKKKGLQLKSLASIASRERNVDMLRGIEGMGSKLYFDCFKHLITSKDFFFEGRNRRPPLDPVNAMLSFVYTLLTNEVLTAVQSVGLDPYLGALHAVEYGRPSLACDLVEEWRGFMGDRLVLVLINRQIVRPDDFIYRTERDSSRGSDDGSNEMFRPVEMKPKVMRALIESYERWMSQSIVNPFTGEHQSYRSLIYNQAQRLLKWFLGKEERFEGFPWDRVLGG